MSAILEGTPDKRLVLVTGRAYPELAEKVAECLGTEILETTSYDFANGEMYVRFTEPVRGADVFVLQCHSGDINKWIMEQLIMIDALKRASAKRITVVAPFYPYARQDKKHMWREPISARLMADLFRTAGGKMIESVYIPDADRATLCVSSQAGCAVGCRFCSTGHQGFSRNLTTGEIVAQLWFAEHFLRQRIGSDGRGAGRAGTPRAGSPRAPALSPQGEGAAGDSGGRFFRQLDLHFQHFQIVLPLQVDLDVPRIDLDVLADDLDQLALQIGQVVGRKGGAAGALVRQDDLQPLLGDAGGLLFLAEQKGEEGHGLTSPRTVA